MGYSPSAILGGIESGHPAIGAPILYVVRHVQNDDDKQKRIRGLKDQPINEEGERQLSQLQDFFQTRPILSVFTDDLSRTRATAMAIAKTCDCGVETDLGLRSWDLGKLEGKSIEAHKMEIRDFKTHPDKVPVGGQSWGEFERTSHDTIDRLMHMAMSSNAPIVIVTHGSFVQVFFERYGEWDAGADYDHSPLDQAGVAAVYLTREGIELKTLRGAKDIDA